MLIPWGYELRKAPDYKKYKAEKFNKYTEKVKMLLNGINQTSLKEADKKRLLIQIKGIVKDFEL